MIIKQSPLGLQEGTSWEDRLKAVECLVCFIVGLVQFLAAMYLEDKGHNILRELLGDLFQLFLVSLVMTGRRRGQQQTYIIDTW